MTGEGEGGSLDSLPVMVQGDQAFFRNPGMPWRNNF